jgi:hypothetical protein
VNDDPEVTSATWIGLGDGEALASLLMDRSLYTLNPNGSQVSFDVPALSAVLVQNS